MTFSGSSPFDDAAFEARVVGARLSPLDRARLIAKRREVYERLNTVSRHGGDRRSEEAQTRSALSPSQSFVSATAAVTPFSPRTVQRALRIGENILPELRDALVLTPLANRQGDLERIASMKPAEQHDLLKRLQDAEQPPPSLSALIQDPHRPSSSPRSNLDRLTAVWSKTSEKHQRQFLEHIRTRSSRAEREEFREWLATQEAQS